MPRVLIIEDEANLRLLYHLELGAAGYETTEVECGSEALAKLAHEKVDAVVLDLKLPDTEGLQLLGEIIARRRNVPIIINTAYEEFRHDFHSWGAEAFVLKSSDLSELKKALQSLTLPVPKKGRNNGMAITA